MTGESRKKFDTFFRTLVSGSDAENPKPKSIKLTKVHRTSTATYSGCGKLAFAPPLLSSTLVVGQIAARLTDD